jgi:hypothetical protein
LGLACDDVTRSFPPTRDRLLKLVWPLMPLSSVTVNAQPVQPTQRAQQAATTVTVAGEHQQKAKGQRSSADLAAKPPAPGEGVASWQPADHGGKDVVRESQDPAQPSLGNAQHSTGPGLSTTQVLAAAAKAAKELAGDQQQQQLQQQREVPRPREIGKPAHRVDSSSSRWPAEKQPGSGAWNSSAGQPSTGGSNYAGGLSAAEEEEVVELEEFMGGPQTYGRGAGSRPGAGAGLSSQQQQPALQRPQLQPQERTHRAAAGQAQVR